MNKFYNMKKLEEISKKGLHITIAPQTRWCYGCDEVKPLDHEHWAWANKEHTRFRTKCRKCTNFDSMISHRIHRGEK